MISRSCPALVSALRARQTGDTGKPLCALGMVTFWVVRSTLRLAGTAGEL